MAKISLMARECTFERRAGFYSMIYLPFDTPIAVEEIETTKRAEIEARMAEIADGLKKARPDRSFFVSAFCPRGERKPNGFNTIRRVEYNPAEARA